MRTFSTTQNELREAFLCEDNLGESEMIFLAPGQRGDVDGSESMPVEVDIHSLRAGDVGFTFHPHDIKGRQHISRLTIFRVARVVPGEGVDLVFHDLAEHADPQGSLDRLAAIVAEPAKNEGQPTGDDDDATE